MYHMTQITSEAFLGIFKWPLGLCGPLCEDDMQNAGSESDREAENRETQDDTHFSHCGLCPTGTPACRKQLILPTDSFWEPGSVQSQMDSRRLYLPVRRFRSRAESINKSPFIKHHMLAPEHRHVGGRRRRRRKRERSFKREAPKETLA